jgi:hypothetical protein
MVSSRTNDLDTAWWGKSSPASTNHDRRASTNRRHGELFPFRISARQILAAVWSSRRTGGGKFSAAASTFARNICTGFSGSLFVLLKGFLLSLLQFCRETKAHRKKSSAQFRIIRKI